MTNPKNKSHIRMLIILGSVVLITTLLATSGKTWLGFYSVQPVLSQSSPKPEVPVLSSPRVNGYVTGGSSGYIPFRGIINQPPSGGKVRILCLLC